MGKFLPSLEVLTLHVEQRCRSGGELPGFLCSAIRGAFGHALRDLAQESDPLGSSPYERVFEGKPYPGRQSEINPSGATTPPVPFIVRAPCYGDITPPQFRKWRQGDLLSYSVSLLGFACDELRHIALALEQVADHGLGSERLRFELLGIRAFTTHGCAPLDLSSAERPLGIPLDLLESAMLSQPICIKTLTPLQIREKGMVLDAPSGADLVKAIRRRVLTLERCLCEAPRRNVPELPENVESTWEDCKRASIPRFSSRQRRALELNGVCGSVQIRATEERHVTALLLAGAVLSVGHSTSMGLGQFKILGAEPLLSCFGIQAP